MDYLGNDIKIFEAESLTQCQELCSETKNCLTFSYKNNKCWIKFRFRYSKTQVDDPQVTSGFPVLGKQHINITIFY